MQETASSSSSTFGDKNQRERRGRGKREHKSIRAWRDLRRPEPERGGQRKERRSSLAELRAGPRTRSRSQSKSRVGSKDGIGKNKLNHVNPVHF